MTAWLIVLGVALGSYLLRVLPSLVPFTPERRPGAAEAIEDAGTAALAALAATSLLHHTDPARPGAVLLAAAALAAAVAVAALGRSFAWSIGAGLAVYWTLGWLTG